MAGHFTTKEGTHDRMLYMRGKGPFSAPARDDTVAIAQLETLIAHYTDLQAKYLRLGLQYEAQLFGEVVEDLRRIEQELLETAGPATPAADPLPATHP